MSETAEKGSLIQRVGVKFCRAFFIVCRCLPQQKRVALLSRQPGRAEDLKAVGDALSKDLPEYKIATALPKPGKHAGIALFLRQVRLAAMSELVITDGYVPAVCICTGLHRAKCIQLWHALGAIKAFGYLAVGTEAGHSQVEASTLHMHEGYDLIIAGLPGAVPTFAQAFNYPEKQVVYLGLPRIDYILDRRQLACDKVRLAQEPDVIRELASLQQSGRAVVLYAPTFRQGESAEVVDSRVHTLAQEIPHDMTLVLSQHPLNAVECVSRDVKDLGEVPTVDALCCVDVVITDYSAVAFEAWLAGCRVLFWTPDIDEYRESPGLVIDPLEAFPDVASRDVQEIGNILSENAEKAESSFDKFMATYAQGVSEGATDRIVKTARELAGI